MQNPKENTQTVKNKKEMSKKKKKKFGWKNYIREFILFVYNKLFKSTGILLVISVLLIAISIGPTVSALGNVECDGLCTDKLSIWADYIKHLQMLLLVFAIGVVPYIYAPVLGYCAYLATETTNMAYAIKDYGVLAGVGASILSLIINAIIVSIVTALGVYICRAVTVSYRISNVKNMNYTNFRIRLYSVLNKQDKVEKLTKKNEDKISKLTAKKEKIAYIQILNIAIIVCILQFVSVLIQHIFI